MLPRCDEAAAAQQLASEWETGSSWPDGIEAFYSSAHLGYRASCLKQAIHLERIGVFVDDPVVPLAQRQDVSPSPAHDDDPVERIIRRLSRLAGYVALAAAVGGLFFLLR